MNMLKPFLKVVKLKTMLSAIHNNFNLILKNYAIIDNIINKIKNKNRL